METYLVRVTIEYTGVVPVVAESAEQAMEWAMNSSEVEDEIYSYGGQSARHAEITQDRPLNPEHEPYQVRVVPAPEKPMPTPIIEVEEFTMPPEIEEAYDRRQAVLRMWHR